VDQAMELLIGFPAGEPDAEGRVPENSVNYFVAAQLMQLSLMRQTYAGGERHRRIVRKKRT